MGVKRTIIAALLVLSMLTVAGLAQNELTPEETEQVKTTLEEFFYLESAIEPDPDKRVQVDGMTVYPVSGIELTDEQLSQGAVPLVLTYEGQDKIYPVFLLSLEEGAPAEIGSAAFTETGKAFGVSEVTRETAESSVEGLSLELEKTADDEEQVTATLRQGEMVFTFTLPRSAP